MLEKSNIVIAKEDVEPLDSNEEIIDNLFKRDHPDWNNPELNKIEVAKEEMNIMRNEARYNILPGYHLLYIIRKQKLEALKNKELYGNDPEILEKSLEAKCQKLELQKKDIEFSQSEVKRQIKNIKQRLSAIYSQKSKLLTIDYSIKPNMLYYNLYTHIVFHPKRKDTLQIDMLSVKRVLTLKPGESDVEGHENLERLEALAQKENKILLDVRVLEGLLKNPHLIPEDWKKVHTYFWGTIFGGAGSLCVPYLCRRGRRWDWHCRWLEGVWNSDMPAAVASV